jgi:hypothetical protein
VKEQVEFVQPLKEELCRERTPEICKKFSKYLAEYQPTYTYSESLRVWARTSEERTIAGEEALSNFQSSFMARNC